MERRATPICAAFLAVRLPAEDTVAGGAEALEARLVECFAAGRAAWPDISLEPEVFARHVAAAGSPLSPRHAGDLYLACGCAQGIAEALQGIDAKLKSEVARSIARACRSSAAVEEVLQELRVAILVAKDGRPPKIATYAGTARLATWLTTAALRIAQRAHRREAANERVDPLADPLLSPIDAELELAKERYRADVEEAIGRALRELAPRQRALLRLHLVEGVTLKRVGHMYHVSRATVARWIADAREAVLAATRQLLRERLGLDDRELESVLRQVRSRLDLSVSALLGPEPPADPH
jgi:RNA polymerase sigma-70 factor (ECF subfamily)